MSRNMWLFVILGVLLIVAILVGYYYQPKSITYPDQANVAEQWWTIANSFLNTDPTITKQLSEPKIEEYFSDSTSEKLEPKLSKEAHTLEKLQTPKLQRAYNPNRPTIAEIVKPYATSSKWKREQRCREILEEYYGQPFPTVRPKFLTNPATGRALELDCYNHNLRIALEHQGEQHYIPVARFKVDQAAVEKQQEHDRFKLDVCDKLGIYLITVPYTVKYQDLEAYIHYYLPENYRQRLLDEVTE